MTTPAHKQKRDNTKAKPPLQASLENAPSTDALLRQQSPSKQEIKILCIYLFLLGLFIFNIPHKHTITLADATIALYTTANFWLYFTVAIASFIYSFLRTRHNTIRTMLVILIIHQAVTLLTNVIFYRFYDWVMVIETQNSHAQLLYYALVLIADTLLLAMLAYYQKHKLFVETTLASSFMATPTTRHSRPQTLTNLPSIVLSIVVLLSTVALTTDMLLIIDVALQQDVNQYEMLVESYAYTPFWFTEYYALIKQAITFIIISLLLIQALFEVN